LVLLFFEVVDEVEVTCARLELLFASAELQVIFVALEVVVVVVELDLVEGLEVVGRVLNVFSDVFKRFTLLTRIVPINHGEGKLRVAVDDEVLHRLESAFVEVHSEHLRGVRGSYLAR